MWWALLLAVALAQEPPDVVFGPEPPAEVVPMATEQLLPASPSEDELFQRLLAPTGDEEAGTSFDSSRRAGGQSVAWGLGVAALGAAGFLAWRRREGLETSLTPTIRVVAQAPLSTQSGLALVEVSGRAFLVGTGAQPPTILADLSEPATAPPAQGAGRRKEAAAQVIPAPRTPAPPSPAVDFEQRLSAAQELVEEMLRKRTG